MLRKTTKSLGSCTAVPPLVRQQVRSVEACPPALPSVHTRASEPLSSPMSHQFEGGASSSSSDGGKLPKSKMGQQPSL